MDSPRVAHSGHERERYLSTRLRSEPDRCKEECPEDSKRRAICVAKPSTRTSVLREAPVLVRSEDICNAKGTGTQSAVPLSTATMLGHASILYVGLRYSYAPDESSHSRSQHAEPVVNAGGRA
jgi:hypothetical protein